MKRYFVMLFCLFALFLTFSVTVGAESKLLPEPSLPDDSWTEDPSSYVDPWCDTSRLRTSGIFTYRILDRTERAATIESVNAVVENLTIPATLDGYKIVCVGAPDIATSYYNPDGLFGKKKDTLKTLTISEGILWIGRSAFANCKNLTSLTLPKNLFDIGSSAFAGCSSLKKVHLQRSKYLYGTCMGDNVFADCSLDQIQFETDPGALGDMPFSGTRIKEVIFKASAHRNATMDIDQAQVGRIWVDPYIVQLDFHGVGWEYHKGSIKKLIVNGKKTEVRSWNKASTLGALYTVPKAKCIKWAKKYKLTYKVKSCGKMGKVTYKKKKATWKKVKTSVRTYKYNVSIRKWKSSSRNVKTYYKVYGKKTKTGSYKLLKTTTKQSYKTKYKYLKVKPVATWS